jgi:GNAT superfamily N-acetyltransferase
MDLRRYDPRDREAVLVLHERALRDAGTDPDDVPGTDDLRAIEARYLAAGGEFLVGVDPDDADAPRTTDGALVAMGGYLPTEVGHDDERDVPDAAELHRMRVAPSRQRQGLGTALLAELEARARADGFERLLATTAARQRASTRFYPARGYREVDRSRSGAYELVHYEKEL